MPLSLNLSHLSRGKSENSLNHLISPEENRKTGALQVDQSLLEVLRRNYDIVTALADIDEPPERSHSPLPQPRITVDTPEMSTTSICSMEGIPCIEGSWMTWLKGQVSEFFRDIVKAFKYPRNPMPMPQENGKLSATALRRDLKRCYTAVHPMIEVGAALQDMIMWKNPLTTLLLCLVFFYSIVRGWTASLLLLLLLLQLGLNYLKSCRNIDIGLCFLPRRPVPTPQFDMSGAQLIFDIAHVVQELLNFGANVLEKAHNLMTWKNERVSFVFFCLVVYWLALSLVFNTGTCLGMCVFTLGIRLLITTYLFEMFPLLRFKLGTYEWFYRNLPVKGHEEPPRIETQRKERCFSVSLCKKSYSEFGFKDRTQSSHNLLEPDARSGSLSNLSGASDDEQMEESDPAMAGVVDWRHCVLHERNRPFPKSIISGIIYLTDVSLVFRAKSPSANNTIPPFALFADIISIKKINTLRTVGLIAGSRKAIEITLSNKRRPITLLGVNERDSFVEKMKEMCQRAEAATHFIIDSEED